MATGYNPNTIPYNPSRDGRLYPPPANGSNDPGGSLKGPDGWISDKAPEAGYHWNPSESKPKKGGKSRRYRKSNRKSNRKSRRRRR